MVDVGIGPGQTPQLRIGVKTAGHILIHEKLEVEPHMPIGPNKNVRAYASLERDVASREGKPTVTAVVNPGRSDLLIGPLENALDLALSFTD
jgi:hypothetical protein